MRKSLFVSSLVVGVAAIFSACRAGSDCDFGLCEGPAVGDDGGTYGDGATGEPVAPPGCKPELDPKEAPPCIVNDFGVFVAPNGKPDAPGTREAPVNSLAAALKIRGKKPRIYLCKGTYDEKIELAAASAVSIFGGFACETWAYTGEKAVFAQAKPGQFALSINAVPNDITLADIDLSAAPGDATNRSSIVAFLADSPKVRFRRLKLTAADGHNGDDGAPGTTGIPNPPDLNGNLPQAAADGGKGGAAKTCTCSSGGTSKGGRGGDVVGAMTTGEPGETAMANPSPPSATGAGQTALICQSGGLPAQAGSDAPPAASAQSPTTLGSITRAGWAPANGAAGLAGIPGQGGGGAGGNSIGAEAGGGGGGGCGGCGGTGGGGGTAGGSSIALLTYNASVKLEAATLIAGKAGDGGKGAKGGEGQEGGIGRTRDGSCTGAKGGTGGAGGAGAGGAGGISVGILHKDGAPQLDPATEAAITFGAAGAPGAGGKPGINDGMPGDAKKISSL